MATHTQALVPIESWSFNSPELLYRGHHVDIGLALESLLYYDAIWINVTNQPQFAEVLDWFIRQGRSQQLLALLQDGTIKFYEYSFATAAIFNADTGEYMLGNLQDPIQAKPGSFEERYFSHPSVQAVLPESRERKQLYRALRESVVEVKAADFGLAVENARLDERRPQRNALVVQAFVDELYAFREMGRPPVVEATVQTSAKDSKTSITWNISFQALEDMAGRNINFGPAAPLTANAISNRLLLSAAQLDCDLFLGSPMSVLVGDKLYESSDRILKLADIVTTLQEKVEFPDVRSLVNDAKLNLDDILTLRANSKKFREWLQTESDRDRDAIIAYHNEVAEETGIAKLGRSSLRLFGLVAAATAGTLIAQSRPGIEGTIAGTAAAVLGRELLTKIADSLHRDWRPIAFGKWMQGRIQKVLSEFKEDVADEPKP